MTNLTEIIALRAENEILKQRVEQQNKMIRGLSADLEKFKNPTLMTDAQQKKHVRTLNGKNQEIEKLKIQLRQKDEALRRKNAEQPKLTFTTKASKTLRAWYPESFA